MKSVRMIAAGRPLELQEIPIPNIGEKDILLRVKAAGICHSDAHYRAGRSSMAFLPITLGHEVAGVVEKIGAQVTNVKEGRASLFALQHHLRRLLLLQYGQRTILRYSKNAWSSCGRRLCRIYRGAGPQRDPFARRDFI